MRTFETGATRDSDDNKLDYEGFLHPLVLQRYAEYMHKHRKQADGKLRASDNWQKGIPTEAYMKSGWRHFMDWWMEHRGFPSREGIEDAICALIFNASGYLATLLTDKEKEPAVALPPPPRPVIDIDFARAKDILVKTTPWPAPHHDYIQ